MVRDLAPPTTWELTVSYFIDRVAFALSFEDHLYPSEGPRSTMKLERLYGVALLSGHWMMEFSLLSHK